jgi:RIO-like serine/threonine protein kinase
MAWRALLKPALARAIPAEPGRAWLTLAALPAETVFAASRTTQTAAVVVPGAGRLVRKTWTWPRRRDRLRGAFRTTWAARSPARREFDALERLRGLAGGPFAPEPFGWVEERGRGVLRACVLVLSEVEDALDLANWLVAPRPRRERNQVLARLARRVREMHDAGLVDFEMHPRNVLVGPSGAVWKVDCAKQRRRAGQATSADRARDLAALDVGLVRLATAAEREAFLAAYGANPALVRAVARARERVDARESRRLPPS